jgi:hypothetical protein
MWIRLRDLDPEVFQNIGIMTYEKCKGCSTDKNVERLWVCQVRRFGELGSLSVTGLEQCQKRKELEWNGELFKGH